LNNRFIKIIPWLLFATAITFFLYAQFSHWAVNSESFGKHDMGLALFFSFSFPIAIYTSSTISVISLLLAPFFRKSNKRGFNILLLSAFVGILPVVYIWALDVVATNAV